ncbi:glycosyltransferase family 4 protein [Candidatus Sumerlaeota bacterium]|nr:glycosyltransferase family 4 protein [Candidatus Sumerlaeota bacterium]
MKILYLCPDLGIPVLGRRGCSTHVRETCCALRAAGHDVTILCSNKGNDEGLAQGLSIVEVKPRRLRKLGYDVRNFWQNVPLYRRAQQIVEREKIEAVYERFSLYSLVGTWLTRRYHLPRMVEVNAFLTVEHRDKLHFLSLARRVEKHVARRAPALVVVSQPLLEALVEIGVEERRISIMPMAVDVTHFRPDRRAGEEMRRKWRLGGRFVIGYVGSLSGWHGISLLHEMAAQLRETREDFVILVVGGEGEQLERNRAKAAQAGLEDHLVFTGSVPYNEVPACINAMDATLVPDTSYWTCPTKMFEYQASGVPTVAPKYPAVLKAIDHGEEGFLFEPRDVSEATRYLLRLADDPELRRAMGEKSRRRVLSTQSWQHNVGRIVNLFERVKSGELSIEP